MSWEDALEKEMAIHSNILTWKIPWTEEPAAADAAKSLQSCLTLCDPIDGSPPGSYPWDSPGKNTGVVCHCLLQCMKVKGKSLSRVRLFATPWTAAYQAPPSRGLYHGRKMDNKLEHNR